MVKRVPPTEAAKNDMLNFELTFTLRNQEVDINSLSANYVIGVNGGIYELSRGSGKDATIAIVGGSSIFINEKIERSEKFYLSHPQKITLSSIMRFLSRNPSAQIKCNHKELEQMLIGEYNNFRG